MTFLRGVSRGEADMNSPSPIESYYRQPELWEMDRYEGNPNQRLRARMVAAMVPDDVESVLDVGCGNGFITRRINAKHVVGLDPSSEALAHFEGEKVCAPAEAIPFEDGSFDAIVCCEVLEHLPSQTLAKVVREIQRVSRRAIIIGVPFDQDLRRGQVECAVCGRQYHEDLHCNRFSSSQAVESLFPGWGTQAEAQLGRTRRPRSRLFRMLRYSMLGPTGTSPMARCPACGSGQRVDNYQRRPVRARVMASLGWRMRQEVLHQWMLCLLTRRH